MAECCCGNPDGTNKECERCRLITEVATITKQRDALLNVCRTFVGCDTQWASAFQYKLLERLLEEMKDITTTDPDGTSAKRCSECGGQFHQLSESRETRC